jgi:hypothetical protein
LRIAQSRAVEAGWLHNMLDWVAGHSAQDDESVKQALKRWVPEYVPDVRKLT